MRRGVRPASTLRPVRLTAPGVALIGVCYGIARFAYGLFVPAFRAEFALTDTLLGVIAAGSYGGYCLAIVVAAAAVTRLGPRVVAAAAGVTAAVGMAGVAAAPTAEVLAAAVLLAGASTGVASPPLAHALARWLPTASQPRAQALVNAAPGVGIALSGPVALLAAAQWRLAWLGFAAIAAVVAAWTALAVPAHGRRGGHRTHLGADLVTVATGRGAWRLATAAALFGAASAATWTFARDHLATELGQTTSILAWIVLGVAGLAAATAGDVIARHGLDTVWRTSLIALAAATAALGVLPTSATTAFAAMAVFGAAYTTLTIAVFFAALHRHPDHPAATVGLGFVMITIGQAMAAPLAGALVDLTDTPATFLTFAALAVATTLLRVTSHHPKLTET